MPEPHHWNHHPRILDAAYTAAAVRFVRAPADQPYGRVAVFEDLYGNRWDLIEHSAD